MFENTAINKLVRNITIHANKILVDSVLGKDLSIIF